MTCAKTSLRHTTLCVSLCINKNTGTYLSCADSHARWYQVVKWKSKKKKKPAGENWLLVDSRGENLYMDGDWG